MQLCYGMVVFRLAAAEGVLVCFTFLYPPYMHVYVQQQQ
jgi:hypothetical protein